MLQPSVDFSQDLEQVMTDAEGRFEYTLLPGVNYDLRIEGGNLRVERGNVDFVEDDLSVKSNEVKDLGDVTLGQRQKAKKNSPAKANP
jgi:hypothetical protein